MKRRQQRILKAIVPAIGVVGVVLWLTLANPLRPDPAEYHPDEENPDVTRALDIATDGEDATAAFVDRAAEAGLDFVHFRGGTRSSRLPEDMGLGAAWGDYDNDGDDDLYVADLAGNSSDLADLSRVAAEHGRGNRLYENLGDGTFRDVTAASGAGAAMIGLGVAWADLDDDGFLDLVVTGYRSLRIFHNQHDGTFSDATSRAQIRQDGFWSGAALADYDQDGDLDLYVCNYVDYDEHEADRIQTATMQYKMAVPFALNPSSFADGANCLYRNEGNLTFREVGASAQVDGRVGDRIVGKSLCAVWVDFNEDGWPDLYVANDVSNNHLFVNQKNGTFAEVGAEAWVADPRGAMGLAIGDFDNDMDADVLVTHWIAQENALFVNLAREKHGPAPGSAALQSGDILFSDRADVMGLGQTTLDFVGWGADFFDFDNDGYLDVFMANGSTFEDMDDRTRLVPMRSQLFRNLGRRAAEGSEATNHRPRPAGMRGFADLGAASGSFFREEHVARGSSVCDYDRDGDLDLLVCLIGEPIRLLRNETSTEHHWISFRLRGSRSNRFAVGAELRLRTSGLERLECVGTDVSYLSNSTTDQHVGLGAYDGPLQVEVRWPLGKTESFAVDRLDCAVILREGAGTVEYVPTSAEFERGAPRGATGSRLKGDSYAAFQRVFREATRLRVAREFVRAESLYREAAAIDPQHSDARYYIGSTLFDQGRYLDAVRTWEETLRLDPKSTKGNFMLGVAHACVLDGAPTDFASATEYFQRVFELNQEESGSILRLGELAIVTGDWSGAARHLQAAVATNFTSVDGHYLLAYVHWKDGHPERALEEMKLALDYAKKQGMPERPSSGVLSEGDIEDPAVLRLYDLYRVRPLAERCLGLLGRSDADVEFCKMEAAALDELVQRARARAGNVPRS